VLFDYGNVLCLPQGRAEVEAMAATFRAPVPDFEQAYWRDRLAFDQAAVTPRAYWDAIAETLSQSLSDADLERVIELDDKSWVYPDPVMVRWAAEIRAAGMRTAVLSNMPITLRSYIKRCCGWLPEFDYSCYSCDIGLAKPGQEIFLNCLEGVGAAPQEALFLDDREENIATARSLGIHAIHFTTPKQAQWEITQRYQLPLPIPLEP
jgi:putative hydrolase of the HAD superfamily